MLGGRKISISAHPQVLIWALSLNGERTGTGWEVCIIKQSVSSVVWRSLSVLVLQGGLKKSLLLEGTSSSHVMIAAAAGCSVTIIDTCHRLGSDLPC
jgi:hypothetical protein